MEKWILEWTKYSKKELLLLPERNLNKESLYYTVLLVNTRKKHESGYNYFAIIGVNEDFEPIEIAGYCDDFRLGEDTLLKQSEIAFDCSMSGVFQIHAKNHKIGIGISGSTTYFKFIKKEN